MKTLIAVLLICSAVACKKNEDAAKTESAPAAKPESAAPAAPTAPAAPATPPATAQEAVDICGAIAKADVEAVVGTLSGEPEAQKAQGSMLGQCNWMSAAGMASVSARPSGEYDKTAASAKDGKEVAGIGEKTVASKLGYLIKLPGKPYMLQVMVMGVNGLDAANTEALAKLAASKL